MRFCKHAALSAFIAATASTGAIAGDVNVTFTHPTRFSDAGPSRWDTQATLDALARHLRALGQRHLPADQVLKVEVLDVDLAGDVRPSRRTGTELRIVKGGADWPRIKLRYVLQTGGQQLLSGEESVADMDYRHGLGSDRSSDPLHYEKRMLDAWFKARFVERRAAAG